MGRPTTPPNNRVQHAAAGAASNLGAMAAFPSRRLSRCTVLPAARLTRSIGPSNPSSRFSLLPQHVDYSSYAVCSTLTVVYQELLLCQLTVSNVVPLLPQKQHGVIDLITRKHWNLSTKGTSRFTI
jgi:hypothetical protein